MENAQTLLNELLSAAEVADLLGISVSTLAIWRCTGRYPLAYVKVGRLVRYRRGDVEAFLEQRTRLVDLADSRLQRGDHR
jgi:excisionase family DNA binding protein